MIPHSRKRFYGIENPWVDSLVRICLKAHYTHVQVRITLTFILEVKNLKSLVRNVVDPSRDLGHVDRALGKEIKARDTAVAPNVTGPVSSSTGPAPTGGIAPSPASRTVAENTDTKPGMGAPAETIQRCGSAGNKNDREECEDC